LLIRRLIFCLRRRLNLALSPLIADITYLLCMSAVALKLGATQPDLCPYGQAGPRYASSIYSLRLECDRTANRPVSRGRPNLALGSGEAASEDSGIYHATRLSENSLNREGATCCYGCLRD
jgi:hypothetical protein